MTSPSGEGDDLTRLGRAVAARRVALGLDSQLEFANRAGVGLSTAAQLERGQVWPRKSTARKIEVALQWPQGTLVALRRGDPIPESTVTPPPTVPAQQPVAPVAAGPLSPQTLAITLSLVHIAGTVVENLALLSDQSAARTMMAGINRDLLTLEAQLAASLPDLRGESFNDTMSTLEELHRRRVELESVLTGG